MSSIPGLSVPVTTFRRFLDWRKMKRFGVDRERRIVLRSWEELYPLYVRNKHYLFDTKKVTLEYSKSPKGNSGARYFKAYQIPPLRYWNPDVEFELILKSEGNPKVVLQKANGTVEEFSVTNMKSEGILQKLSDTTAKPKKK